MRDNPASRIAASLLVTAILLGSPARAVASDEQPDRASSKAVAVIMWVGLAILSVALLGIGLIWGVSRAARRLLKRRDAVHTEMPDIWFLNPPEKRRRDEP